MTEPAFGCVGSTTRLESGIYFDLQHPRAEDITLSDIAGALSRICRFGGHCGRFYSVAEHSWHVADQARRDGLDVFVQRAALLHDAAEAYVGDVVKPLKVMLSEYKYIEWRIMAAIRERFRLPPNDYPVWGVIRRLDQEMLIAERRALFTHDDTVWTGEKTVRTLDRVFYLELPNDARKLFLSRAEMLGLQ